MEWPKRKHPRLKDYDYSLPGYYYVTIHIVPDGPILSHIRRATVPAEADVMLTDAGGIAQEQLFLLEERYPYVKVDKYVIMPTHIHMILAFADETTAGAAMRPTVGETEVAGAAMRPALSEVIGAYKSLTTRAYNRQHNAQGQKLFQVSFYETVLRNEKAYQECWRYIDGNPGKWLLHQEETEWNRP